MVQVLPRFCPRCGAPTVADQQFCANCGLKAAAMQVSSDSIHVSQDHHQDQALKLETQASEKYLQAPGSQQGYQYAHVQSLRTDQQTQQPPLQPASVRNAQISSYRQSPTGRRNSKIGLVLILLALLVVLGTATSLVIAFAGIHLPGLASGGGSQPQITAMTINSTVIYAGVDITVLKAQQSQSFIDDPDTSTDGMVRLNLQEQNKTDLQVSWSYYDIARLILPDKTSMSPKYVKAKVGIAAGATQMSVVDFAVPISEKIGQLILRIGAANEAQMDVPLTEKADLSRYQPRTTHLKGQMLYFGLNWTLTDVITSLSVAAQQASGGMRYLALSLKVDNTLSQVAIPGSPYDYMRLKFGNSTALPKNSTLPVSFDVGAMSKSGSVTFLVPQNTTAFTLLLLAQSQNSNDQASTDFQVA